jgi:hypothetical protein
MRMIDPIYDPVARVWFHGETEAPTVRELLVLVSRKKQHRTGARNYYPDGAPPPVWPKDVRPQPIRPKIPQNVRGPAPATPLYLRPSKYDHLSDKTLDAWFNGDTAIEIGERFGVTEDTIRTILTRARRVGDARAIRKSPPGPRDFA